MAASWFHRLLWGKRRPKPRYRLVDPVTVRAGETIWYEGELWIVLENRSTPDSLCAPVTLRQLSNTNNRQLPGTLITGIARATGILDNVWVKISNG